MTKFRRLGLLKPKREKVARKVERVPQLRLMGLKHKELKEGEEAKVSHQIKINGLAVTLLGLQKGDKIDILQREDNTFLIGKVSGEKEGRTLSANKNTDSLSLTFGTAHNLMKEISNSFEVTNEVVTAQDEEEKQLMGNYSWYVLTPMRETTPETTVTSQVSSEKIEEKVGKKNVFF